jgi:hypothetical protein
MKSKHYLVIAGGISLGLVIVLVLMGVARRSVGVGLSNGGSARITFSKNSCKIVYQPRDGEAGTVAFYASSILQLDTGQPAFMAPATDSHCLLILYDADVHYRLVRVDPSKPFTRFPENSYLSYIVQSSPWKIEEGTSNDWEEVCSYLKTVPQKSFNREAITTLDLGLARFHYRRQELLSEVEREIYNGKHGYVY